MISRGGLIFAVLTSPAFFTIEKGLASTEEFCYSAYKLTQNLDLSVNFGLSLQQRNNYAESEIHVRELAIPDKTKHHYQKISSSDSVKSYLFLTRSYLGGSKESAENHEVSQGSIFVAYVDAVTGSLLDHVSSSEDSEIVRKNLAHFDLFQYSHNGGLYQYRNGNGWYQGRITRTLDSSGLVVKENIGYKQTGNGNTPAIEIVNSRVELELSEDSTACFYQSATGNEQFESVVSSVSMVEGSSEYTVELVPESRLPATHFFFELSDDVSSWPGVTVEKRISQAEAFDKLEYSFTYLSGLLAQDAQFKEALLRESDTWPYLASYILDNGISDELSKKLFWALDSIDSKASVKALSRLVSAPLQRLDHFRAVMALSSTSAPFDDESLELLKGRMSQISTGETINQDNLPFVRMLGAMADRRQTTDPVRSAEIRDYLYAQSGVSSELVNAALISSIGNLGSSIDSRGETILLDALNATEQSVRLSAASAFRRLPYREANTSVLVDAINSGTGLEAKKLLIDAVGNASKDNTALKNTLIALLSDDQLASVSLKSLVNVGFDLNGDDIASLKSRLRVESSVESQKNLARLILSNSVD